MKTAIVYESRTGNTKRVAQAIKENIGGADLVYFGAPRCGLEADLFIVGSWTDKGMCAEAAAAFLKGLSHQTIAWFGTAGFGGSAEYYQALFQRVKGIIPSGNRVLGSFYCQGKMPAQVRARYEAALTEHPGDARILSSIKNFDQAVSHPDGTDLQAAGRWAAHLPALL